MDHDAFFGLSEAVQRNKCMGQSMPSLRQIPSIAGNQPEGMRLSRPARHNSWWRMLVSATILGRPTLSRNSRTVMFFVVLMGHMVTHFA